MRVRIAHEEKRSWIFKIVRSIDVLVQVEFSAFERAVIEDRRLGDFIVLERYPESRVAAQLDAEELKRWAAGFHLRVRHLLEPEPNRFSLDTPADAKAYQARVSEALEQLKAFIDSNAKVERPLRLNL